MPSYCCPFAPRRRRALLPASKADAYKLFKHRWYSKTLTYYDATGGRYKRPHRAAASVLNRNGARIKVRSASRRSAESAQDQP